MSFTRINRISRINKSNSVSISLSKNGIHNSMYLTIFIPGNYQKITGISIGDYLTLDSDIEGRALRLIKVMTKENAYKAIRGSKVCHSIKVQIPIDANNVDLMPFDYLKIRKTDCELIEAITSALTVKLPPVIEYIKDKEK